MSEQNKQESSSNQESSSSESRIPATLSDLVQSYEAAEEKCKQRGTTSRLFNL